VKRGSDENVNSTAAEAQEEGGAGRGGGGGRALVLDYDGTITEVDMLDQIALRFGDVDVYREVEDGLLAGEISLRECITREFEPVRAPLGEVLAWMLEHVRVRAGLAELVRDVRARGWRAIVLSSGFEELIRPVLEQVGIAAEVELQANRVVPSPKGWRVLWREETTCTVCGEQCKRTALPPSPHIVYVGDGISDRCPALASDRVFATRGLARYLDEQDIPYEPFSDFRDVAARLDR
jgi:2-hydroxy-3-keto-5-methylthiopentenyl-1-phosphate phosphatase